MRINNILEIVLRPVLIPEDNNFILQLHDFAFLAMKDSFMIENENLSKKKLSHSELEKLVHFS